MWAGAGGAAIGAIANVGMGLYNAHKSAKEARAADARQYAYSIQSAQEMPKAQRLGLEAAGYNPMLALGDIGGSSAMASHQGTSNVSLDGSSAKALGEFAERLFKDKFKAEVDNIKADTELKKGQLDAAESQRLQNEANTALLYSQTERSDLAYGRDIVGTAADVAGTAGSLYSAKAMSDVAKANSAIASRNATVNERRLNQHKFELTRDKNGRKVFSRESNTTSWGHPTVNNTSKAKTPNVGGLGHSAKSVSRVAKDVAKSSSVAKDVAKSLTLLAPFAGAGLFLKPKVEDISRNLQRRYKGERYWNPRRVLLH